ncbi:carboxymuconolactone decarboxylase family protein [Pararhizobium mangrovi]|uniref:Carboxymuconolactone decarboxylase family protein n=1 Tax=Pararhizobium mangrovi TaxID=2590452 RepID=A0A506UB74_9HYPH|nr:carboxymuconolactone decarboxylase family protein [Pararhizobium mangrovi]TPW30371.1 carboxymuconolactone decarboxylase family protein [Pararhizobium mangrovi]
MANKYYDAVDAEYRKQMATLAPKDFQAWMTLNAIPGQDNGQIPPRTRELIAIAVAHATGCPYCIESHVNNAKKLGVTKAEVAESVMISAAMKAGSAAAQGGLAMKFFGDDDNA